MNAKDFIFDSALQIATCLCLLLCLMPSEAKGAKTSAPLYLGIINPESCSEMEVWDVDTAMCMPFPMAGMPMTMLMFHGNVFGVGITESGSRGRSAFASPNMIMADVGTMLGDRHYLNLDFMGTAEKWTFPDKGYPELLQIGENDDQGNPYVDAQHPHSSPIMGLTLSDTIRLGNSGNHLKFFVAPRGMSTDGPIPFMHRPTGMVNPDAPLGHHIGQDVGHISGSVIGGAVQMRNTRLEVSTFDGTEPEPTKVDLPIEAPDSFAIRLVQRFSPKVLTMASVAHINQPEADLPDIHFQNRYSASAYSLIQISDHWQYKNALIFGLITNYEFASTLGSITEEFLFSQERHSIWGRMEAVQRTPSQLQIATADSNSGHWVGALTLGYGYALKKFDNAEIRLGGSATVNLLPQIFQSTYGGTPWTGKIFVQVAGMRMWDL